MKYAAYDIEWQPEKMQYLPFAIEASATVAIRLEIDIFERYSSAYWDEHLDQIFAVMALTPQHTYQVLTKHPERMLEYFTGDRSAMVAFAVSEITHRFWGTQASPTIKLSALPLLNAWLGVTCEDQRTADDRIPLLLKTPAAVRFLSCEPLLEDLYLNLEENGKHPDYDWGIDWVIAGGESGHKGRFCDITWIRSIVDQCESAGVPCFVKQLGSSPVVGMNGDHPIFYSRATGKGNDPEEWPEDLRVREFPPSRFVEAV